MRLDDAAHRVRTAIAEGVSEIWLSSEDTGAYGIDIGTDITRLLKDITAVLPTDGSCMLRLAGPPSTSLHVPPTVQRIASRALETCGATLEKPKFN